ncbi:esterase/lipase family protein [Peredibacter starrii]|uniref:Alpha/beta fold hydrolase n=1 Tax=Peredibacter starrii TaxID=28202 RepID=A0AAX4HQD0_9BACT|nr:alpha/beta fold hydrolase [Peredibacter starrii]WPU65326.1 alpha/beta fold hydrolase [Peredibacter starrii]
MKFLFCFLFLTSFAFAECVSKNHIFLIHGIGGGKSTFGSLEKILNAQNECYQARSFEYDTGSDRTPKEFSQDFHKYVSSFPIAANDKISLVMHSQGGLVGTLWLNHLLTEKLELLKQVDAFVTLSTPFWGANTAHVGKVLFYSLPAKVETNPVSPFGRNELNEMSFGSATIHEMSQNLESIFASIPNLRPLAVAGMRRKPGPKLGEDDLIVPTYSMRPNRIYLKDDVQLFNRMARSPASFVETNEIPFVMVPADHIRLTQAGVAYIPEKCEKDLDCGHPSLKFILDQIKGNQIGKGSDYDLARFRFTMFVTNPENLDYENKDLTIEIGGLDKKTKVPLMERFTPKLGNAKLKEGLAFTFRGSTKELGTKSLEITLKYKNRAIKTYTAPIEAGRTTFLDVALK